MTNTKKNTNIKVEKDVRLEILKGINKVYRAVSKTMGPHGRTSAIITDNPNAMPKFTKDGHTVATAIFESDPYMGIGVGLVKDVVNQTVATSWDGTSISTILTYNMFANGYLDVEDTNYNVNEYKRGMVLAGKDIKNILRGIKQEEFDKKSVHNIALTSSNGDTELAECISENYEAFGLKKSFANISIYPVHGGKTRIETNDGYKLITNPLGSVYTTDRDLGVLASSNDRFLVFDTPVDNWKELVNRLDFVEFPTSNTRDENGLHNTLFIVAPAFHPTFIEDCVNAYKAGINIVMIKAPYWGETQIRYINDFAVMVNAEVQSVDATNTNLEFDIDDIGLSKNTQLYEQYLHVATGFNESENIEYFERGYMDMNEWKTKWEERKKSNLERLENEKSNTDLTKAEVSIVEDRINAIHGIEIKFYIQSLSEIEVMERIDRARDALHAVLTALDEGFISGGGTTLFKISNFLMGDEETKKKLEEMSISSRNELVSGYTNVLNSIRKPFIQILDNAGIQLEDLPTDLVTSTDYDNASGINVKTGAYVDDMIKEGIIDPVKVAISAVTNSIASIATALTINSGLHIGNDTSVVNHGFDLRYDEGEHVLTREQLDLMLDFSQFRDTKEEIEDQATAIANNRKEIG